MLGEIIEILGNKIVVEKNNQVKNDVINLYVKITDKEKIYVGEIIGLNRNEIEINLIGEIIN